MTEAKRILVISVIGILTALAHHLDFRAAEQTPAGMINRPAFSGKPSIESQYVALRDKYPHLVKAHAKD